MFTTDPRLVRLRTRGARLLAERDRLRSEVKAAEETAEAVHKSLTRMVRQAEGVERVAALARPAPKQAAALPVQTSRR